MNDPRQPAPGHPAPHAPNHAPSHQPHPAPVAPGQPVRPAGMTPHHPQPAHTSHAGHQPVRPAPIVPRSAQSNRDDSDPIALVDDGSEEAVPASKKIKAFGPESHRREHHWKRQAQVTGQGAVRVRSFHGKYSDQGMEYLDEAINEWLDNHPEVEVKFVTSTVAVFEGKIREPALVLNLWY
ncbi:MAG: hypothetical protein ACREJC_19465 [Tepidisphaeraceae bacterium]